MGKKRGNLEIMRKGIIRDYLGEYNRGNGKGQFNYLWMCIYWMFSPMWTVMDKKTVGISSYWITGLVCLPMLLSSIATAFHPVSFSKMMYLCPMSGEERKKSLKDMYIFRVGVHCVISFILVVIVARISYCNWISAILLLGNDFMFAFLIRPKDPITGKLDISAERWLWFFLNLSVIVSNGIQAYILIDEAEDLWVNVMLALVFVCIQLPMAWHYSKCVRQRFEEVVRFQEV